MDDNTLIVRLLKEHNHMDILSLAMRFNDFQCYKYDFSSTNDIQLVVSYTVANILKNGYITYICEYLKKHELETDCLHSINQTLLSKHLLRGCIAPPFYDILALNNIHHMSDILEVVALYINCVLFPQPYPTEKGLIQYKCKCAHNFFHYLDILRYGFAWVFVTNPDKIKHHSNALTLELKKLSLKDLIQLTIQI